MWGGWTVGGRVASAFFLLASFTAQAQIDFQKIKIDKLVLKFVTNKPSTNRCLLWFPFDNNQKPITEFDEEGKPFTRARLRAKVRGKECNVSYRPQEIMRLIKQEQNDLYFEVIVHPPVTVVDFNGFFNGPDFRDQLIFEASSDELEEVDFFTFFKKSKVYFESRYSTISSNNPGPIAKGWGGSARLLPVFGGKIGVPLPWIERLIIDFSMFQNLGNFTPDKDIRVQYSEFSVGANYVWSGRESWGRPQVIPAFDYRGRNVYQTFISGASTAPYLVNGVPEKPFLIGNAAMPGLGVDLGWFPGGAFFPWEHWASRIGLDFSTRFYFGGKVNVPLGDGTYQATSVNANLFDVALQYRLTRKWAIAGGWSRSVQNMNYPSLDGTRSTAIRESMSNFFVRLLLVPYIVEEAAR